MSYIARYNQQREYESPVHEYRVAKGFYVKELAVLAKTAPNNVVGLANGMLSPLFVRTNKLKPWVQRIADVLDVDAEDLIPRYACKLHQINHLTDMQIIDISNSRILQDIEGKRNSKVFWKTICQVLKVSKQHRFYKYRKNDFLVVRLFSMGYTLQEIVDRVTSVTSSERARQILAKILRRLRHPRCRIEQFAEQNNNDINAE